VASPRKASSLGEWPRTCIASGRGGLRDGVDHQDQPAGDPEAVASRIGRSSERNVRETRLKRRDRVARVLTPPLPGPTFRAAVRDVLDDYRMNRKHSLLDVERHVRLHLGPFFGRRRLAAITTADVRRYVLGRQDEGAKNATINRELAILKRAFRLAEILRPFRERYFITGELNMRVDDVGAKLREIEERFGQEGRVSHLDGVSVDADDWHMNVRPSNTEPLLRLNLEARTPELMERKRDEVLAVIQD